MLIAGGCCGLVWVQVQMGERALVTVGQRPVSAGGPGPGGVARRASRRDGSTGPSELGRNGPALEGPGWHYAGRTDGTTPSPGTADLGQGQHSPTGSAW